MASNAMASSSSLTVEESRPQAGPLPSKRGEIGYQEETEPIQESGQDAVIIPAVHPADREAQVPADVEPAIPVEQPPPTPATEKTLFKPKLICGISLTTLFIFILQVLFISGSIAAWVIAVMRLNSGKSSDNIFIHVVFAIAIIGQLLFLERRIFRIRAERYAFLHPGQVLPTHNRPVSQSSAYMGFAPWHRPPLPTYAAALAQSGHGTGDVEDNIIAAPPPPAYGNTRGSRLLLTGFLRASLRAQRPASVHSQSSQVVPSERPLSYMSTDEQWEEIRDAERARVVEETLTRLEEGEARR